LAAAPVVPDREAASTSWEQLAGFGVDIPFVRHLGFVLTQFASGQSEITYTAQPAHLNSFGVTHGGALMTLLDVSMATAARSDSPEQGVVTIEMKTSFMHPAVGALLARGTLVHRTATMAFTQSTIIDAQGRACASAMGTFKFMKRSSDSTKALSGAAPSTSPISTD
jgi:uncharacterized protein (TIGR00369 family)